MIKLTPGKLYRCIDVFYIEKPHFGSPCEYTIDANGSMIHGNSLDINDVIMFVKNVWVPNVTLYQFTLKNKLILLSSYYDQWYNDVLVEI